MKLILVRLCILFIGLAVVEAVPGFAQTPRQITWEQLVPGGEKPLLDPFAHLEPVLAAKLYGIGSARQQVALGFLSPVSPEYEAIIEMISDLETQGVEVRALLARFDEAEAEARRQDSAVDKRLEGQLVRIPGYALPLEYDGAAIHEFLLVPYVGACIHVPPPPPNQMLFVKLSEPFIITDLFTPVWITGRVVVQATETIVPLSDGKAPVTAGYVVEVATVEPYRE